MHGKLVNSALTCWYGGISLVFGVIVAVIGAVRDAADDWRDPVDTRDTTEPDAPLSSRDAK